MKLQAKILLMLAPVIVVPLLVLGWVAYDQMRARAERDTLNHMDTLLHQVQHHMNAYVATAVANTRLFSASDQLRRYVLTEDEAQRFDLLQPSVLALFAGYQRAYPQYYEIRVLLPDGYEDTRSTLMPIANLSEEEGDSAFFRAMQSAAEDVHVSAQVNPDTGEPALLVGRRISLVDASVDPIASRPRLRAYLVVTASLEPLARLVRESRVGSSGRLLVADHGGRVLFHPDAAQEGTYLDPRLLSALAAQRPHLDGPATHVHFDGRFFDAHRLLPGLDAIGVLPEAEFRAMSRRLAGVVAAVTLSAIVVMSVLLYSTARTLLLTPLQRLRDAAREIGRGNLGVTVSLGRRDEFGDLAKSFEEMGASLRRSSDQVRYLAYHDSLTGLPNRRMFLEYAARAIAQASREGALLAVVFMDVDDFKRVNDTLGHEAGDQLLTAMAERLLASLRDADVVARPARPEPGPQHTVARLGGDEFTVLLPLLAHPHDAARVAKRILAALDTPFLVRGHELVVSASVGIAVHPGDGEDVETLLKHADLAMYHAKAAGKNGYHFFRADMNEAALNRLSMENALRKAISNGELLLHYQAQVDSAGGALVGLEALVRWQHPQLGLVPPDRFIPLAEESGLILALGEWVLHEACRQNRAWQAAGLPPIRISVNVSNRQFERGNLERVVRSALHAARLDPCWLEVEITETSIMHAQAEAIESLHAIKALGVRISMDDFGTGYSSLSALRHLPIDVLKIDRGFVADLPHDRDNVAIVSAIQALAQSLHLEVIAEGVETEAQLAFLREMGCRYVQGYLIGRPVPAAESARLRARWPAPAAGAA